MLCQVGRERTEDLRHASAVLLQHHQPVRRALRNQPRADGDSPPPRQSDLRRARPRRNAHGIRRPVHAVARGRRRIANGLSAPPSCRRPRAVDDSGCAPPHRRSRVSRLFCAENSTNSATFRLAASVPPTNGANARCNAWICASFLAPLPANPYRGRGQDALAHDPKPCDKPSAIIGPSNLMRRIVARIAFSLLSEVAISAMSPAANPRPMRAPVVLLGLLEEIIKGVRHGGYRGFHSGFFHRRFKRTAMLGLEIHIHAERRAPLPATNRLAHGQIENPLLRPSRPANHIPGNEDQFGRGLAGAGLRALLRTHRVLRLER